MSAPPQYKQSEDEEASVGLLSSEQHLVQRGPPSAPTASGSWTGPRSVVYHLRPRYPLTETLPEQDAVSVQGQNREESLELAISAFPGLAKVAEHRIDFLVPSDPHSAINSDTRFARITDAGWPNLQASVIRIEVQDLPGDDEARLKFNLVVGSTVLCFFLGILAIVVIGIKLFS